MMPGPSNGPRVRTGGRRMHPMTQRFAEAWLWLDDTPLRVFWPFLLGALMAGLALVVTRHLLVAVGVTALLYSGLVLWGRSVARQLEDIHRLSD